MKTSDAAEVPNETLTAVTRYLNACQLGLWTLDRRPSTGFVIYFSVFKKTLHTDGYFQSHPSTSLFLSSQLVSEKVATFSFLLKAARE